MTTEEKAKAYDEALERAKQKHGKFSEFVTKTIEEIFPELHKNDDEESYKRIEQLIRLNTSGAEKTRLLAYLEKYKESLHVSKICKENANSFTDEDGRMRELIIDRVRSAAQLTDGLRELLLAYLEQKPAEKQDYSGLNDLERAIHRGFLCAGVKNVPVAIISETAKECLEQIKPVGWSEEDNEMFHCICDSLCYLRKLYEKNEDAVSDYNAMLEWFRNCFKFLRPSWKPSEEQVEELWNVISYIEKPGSNFLGVPALLKSLYNQLKRLM